jgi:hypothetical protein
MYAIAGMTLQNGCIGGINRFVTFSTSKIR